MKKIVIFGSYNNNSIGDTAILLGLISSINRICPDCHIIVLTVRKLNLSKEIDALDLNLKLSLKEVNVFYDKKNYQRLFGKVKWYSLRLFQKIFKKSLLKIRKIKSILKDADHLLIGGGNLIMDLFPEWPLIIRDITNIASSNNTKYSFIGVGAAPISSELGKKVFFDSLNNAHKVYFRDYESLKYCEKKIGYSNGFVCPDCAFGIEWNRKSSSENTLVLNLASVFGKSWPYKSEYKFNAYINAIYNTVLSIVEVNNISQVIIYNTNYPLDEEAVLSVLKLLENSEIEVSYIEGLLTVSEIIDLCSESKFALVTRLHAGILASIAQCQVLAVAYQPKVKDVLASIMITDNVIDIEEFIKHDHDFSFENLLNIPIDLTSSKTELDKSVANILD